MGYFCKFKRFFQDTDHFMNFRHLLIFFCTFSTLIGFGQNAVSTPTQTFPLHVEGYVTDLKGNGIPGVAVAVNAGGKIVNNIITDGTGKYAFDLPLNNDYAIMVSKPGLVTKKYSVSTRGVPEEKSTSKFSTVEASLTLFEKLDGVDYSLLNQPLNKYSYNPTKDNFEYDKNYLDQMLGGLQNLMAAQQAELNKRKDLEANYQSAIKAGDKAFQKNDWQGAKASYQAALALKPNESWPKAQLAQIDKTIAELAALEKKKADDAKKAAEDAAKKKIEEELNAKYLAAIKKGDDAFAKKDWPVAKAGYNEALTYKTAESYPKNQLAAIDKAMADAAKADAEAKAKAEAEAKYVAAIKKGDDAFAKKDWPAAKAGYTEATGLKPTEQYPKDKLAAIEKAIADDAAAAKNKAELEAKYLAAIKKGDDAFAKKDWIIAKAGYNEAIGIKASEQYPKDKIAAIDKAIADEAAAKAKADADAKAKAELEAKYLAALKKGDDAFATKSWVNAKAGYQEALGFKPAEQYPKDKIAAIDKALADEAAAKAKAEGEAKAKAELEAKYLAAIKKGDDAFTAKTWANAKAGYNEALSLKPTEQYPKDKIAAIDKLLADEAAAKAKADADAKAKAELEAKYLAAIKKGDDAFTSKTWTTARTGYTEALGIKPNEQYPKDRLAAIDKAIADEKANMDAAAKAKAEAELNAKYQAAIKKGDDAFAAKTWQGAKNAYNEALGFKPTEKYPKDQIILIDKALADEAAAKAKAEGDAKAKAELEAKYLAGVKKGDDAFNKKDWANARVGYNEAIGIKPTEQYPKDKLAAIDKAIADEKANMDAAAKAKAEAELNAKYQAAIKKGDDAFNKKDWANARVGYNDAIGIKPTEQYPKDKLAAIDKAIADEDANKDAAAKAKAEAELNAKYNAAIKMGDAGFAKKDWPTARGGYNEALGYKPAEQYPKDKLAAIDKAIADEKANMDAAAKAKAEAELNAKYNAAIKKGDDAYAKKDWATARTGYTAALGIKPDEQYPKDKLSALDKIAAAIKAAATNTVVATPTGVATNTVAAPTAEDKYNAAIKKANENFDVKNYKPAKKLYEEALIWKGGDTYAMGRLAEIEKILNSDANTGLDERKKALLAKYPPGVTEETITGNGVVIIQRVVVKDNDVWVFQKKIFSWGGIAYFRDGTAIIELTFENETKP
jgi:hypothetical protein